MGRLIHRVPVRKLLIGTLALIVLAHALAHGLIMSFIWVPAIQNAEKKAAEQYATTLSTAIRAKKDAMLASTRDYAEWEAMYQYVTGSDTKKYETEIGLNTLDHERLLLDGIFIIKEDGSLGATSLANNSRTEDMNEIRAIVSERMSTSPENESFHLLTNQEEIIIVTFARPKSTVSEPFTSNGAVVQYISLKNAMMQTNVRPHAVDSLDPNERYYQLTGNSGSLTAAVHKDHSSATTALPVLNAEDKDVHLRVYIPLFIKPLFTQNAPYSFMAALLTWLFVALAVYYFVDNVVLRSFETLARKAKRLADGGWKDSEKPFRTRGTNEAAQLADAINKLCQAQSDAFHRANSLYKQAKNNLESYRTIFNNSGDPMLITYKKKIVDLNEAAEKALGLSADVVIGREYLDVARPSSNEVVTINAKIPTRTQYQINERDYLESRNSIRWGSRNCSLRTLADITEVKQLQRRMIHAEKMQVIGEFSSGVAHDINNILGSIIGHQQLVELLGPLNEKQKESNRNIEAAVHQGSQLVKRLLKFAKGFSETRRIIELVTLVRETTEFVKTVLPGSVQVELVTDIPSSMQRVNEDDILQLLMNLCVNASQAMNGHGKITIVLAAERLDGDSGAQGIVGDKEFICLTVRDNGPGVPEPAKADIFKPFFTTKNDTGGTGLGLATVKKICDGYGWSIAVHNETGAVFKISMTQPEVTPQQAEKTSGEITWFQDSYVDFTNANKDE